MNSTGTRSAIPGPLAREVRQRCGFGCVICGMPFYQYEHMAEWAQVHRHLAEEITLLCYQHHGEKTNGLLPKDVVAAANAAPWNHRTGVSKPYDLHFSGKNAEIAIGNYLFTCENTGYGFSMTPISIDGIPMISFILGDDHLLLNIMLFNEFNEVVLHIKNNTLIYKINSWDITLVGTTFIIREDLGKILINIEFQPPNKVKIVRGKFLCNGIELEIHRESVKINGDNIIGGMHAHNCAGGLILGPHTNEMGGALSMRQISRYKKKV